MPGLNSAVYHITSWADLSPQLPSILKDYVKAAIRTDPVDLLQWSRDYFRELSRGTLVLPDKDRWEDPSSQDHRSGITNGLLRVLHKQLSFHQKVTLDDVSQHWMALGLQRQKLDDLLELIAMATPPTHSNDNESSFTDWNKLVALAAGQLGHSLAETMTVLCQVLTVDQDGGSSLDANIFIEMYSYLAHIDGDIPQNDIDAVVKYVGQVAELQDGKINQFNLQSQCCPDLH